MGLFDRFKKQPNINDEYRNRSISDVQTPVSFTPVRSPSFPDPVAFNGEKYEKCYYYSDIPARLFGSLPSSGRFDFSDDGRYLLCSDKRIASVSSRSDMIRDFKARGDLVLVEPFKQSGSDLLLAACFYKKISSGDAEPQIIEYSVKVASDASYYSCSELAGLMIDDFHLDPDLSYSLYSDGILICPLSDAKAERISALERDGYVFRSGSVISASETDSGLSYVLRIRLDFI